MDRGVFMRKKLLLFLMTIILVLPNMTVLAADNTTMIRQKRPMSMQILIQRSIIITGLTMMHTKCI